MKIISVTLFLIFFLLPQQLLTNELQFSTSPYLLQHADNPVNWMPWGKKAFALAKAENKPIFLSIGYSTCHWCHVMERDSFTNKKIAKLLNRYFISIKVDREELPQIDALYQKIYKKYSGRVGGWPLSVFMTPQREPFYITTFIPSQRQSYAQGMDTLLPQLHMIYTDKAKLQKSIAAIKKGSKSKKKLSYQKISLDNLVKDMQKKYDDIYEGFGQGKKFPEAVRVSLMLDLVKLSQDSTLREDLLNMLDTMALRGLYDHVDGGFFRYSVDAAWEIPHFEKMLYNQAELIKLYSDAYLFSAKPLYKKIVFETISMCERRFEKDGLFWSASDADLHGEEGGYYTFSLKEIASALADNPNKKEILTALDMYDNGNFEGKEHLNFFTATRPKGFRQFQKKLQAIRAKRVYPFIDKKINTAWNAMMIEALFKASVLNKNFAKKAEFSLKKLTENIFVDRKLYHQKIAGKRVKQEALLEDYAFLIGALISAYETDYDLGHLHFAEYLFMQAKEKFYKNGLWYLSDDGLAVPAGVDDKYYQSVQSKILEDIVNLAALKGSFSYEKTAQRSMKKFQNILKEKVTSLPGLAKIYLMQKYGVVVLKASQSNLKNNRKCIAKISYPYLLTKAKEYDDYLACTLRQCFAKEKNIGDIIEKIVEYEKYKIGK